MSWSYPDGDLNDDMVADVLDVQLCVNVFLGSQLDPTIAGRADTRCVNNGVVSGADINRVVLIFLEGYD